MAGKRKRDQLAQDEENQINEDLETLKGISSAMSTSGRNTNLDSEMLLSPRQKKRLTGVVGQVMTPYDSVTTSQLENEGSDIQNGTKAEAGYIQKVILKNFMCHDNFEMELGPGLNFIVGNNGSGKSAILTAISICLGAKANTTNRGNSLKDLIKNGRNQSTIQVVLNNEGTNAFEPETYGSEIIIERVLKRDGATQYKIRSENMKEVSSKKKTLDSIVDFFSIPVANPMCFLSQDAARSFLTASTSADKYSHFMKGTLIEETTGNHQLTIDKIESIRNTLQLHQQHVKSLLKDHKAAKSLYQSMRSNVNLLERKRNLQGKLIWLNVEANEGIEKQLLARIETYKKKIEEFEDDIIEKNDLIKDVSQRSDEVQEKLAAYEKEALERSATTKNWLMELNILAANERSEHDNIKLADAELRNTQKMLEQTERIFKEKTRQNEQLSDEHQIQQKEKIDELVQRVQDMESKSKEIDEQLTSLASKKSSAHENFQSVKNALNRSIMNNKNELNSISTTKNDIHSAFHPQMKQALGLINQLVRQGKFNSPPIGPLGLHVSVKEEFAETWSRPIQNVLNRSLRSFVVTNVSDEHTLKSILRKYRIDAQIINRRMKSFDYSMDCPRIDYPTVADALTFDNNEIACTFVDLNSIHTTALIEDRNVARNVLKSGVRNLRLALSIKSENSMFRSSAYGSSFSVDTINNLSAVITMKTVAQQDFSAYYRSKILEEEAQLKEHTKSFSMENSRISEEMSQLNHKKEKMYQQRRMLFQQKTSLEVELNKVVDVADLDMLQQKIETQKETILITQRTLETLHENIRQIQETKEPMKASYDAAKKAEEKLRKKCKHKEEGMVAIQKIISECKDEIASNDRNIKAVTTRIQEYQAELDKMASNIQEIVRVAESHCSREIADTLDIENDEASVKAELTKVDKQIKTSEKNVGMSHEDTRELFEQTREKFDVARKRVYQLEEGVDILATSVQSRLDALAIALKATCLNADVDFKRSLRFRDFTGSLDFDNEKKALRVFVQTRNDVTARDVDTLSGGEKSYSQISLLLATWKPMKSRIIALDEFDVFMDQVNRSIGTKLIMHKLSANLRMQTIIITPQDISKIANLEEQKNIQIKKMNDPQRQNNSTYFNNS